MSDRNVWVGSLHTYNSGWLIGSWYPADQCPQEASEWVADHLLELQKAFHTATVDELESENEELWVFDHEGYPKGIGEMSPMEVERIEEVFADAERRGISESVLLAYVAGNGGDLDDGAVDEAERTWRGSAGTLLEYVEETWPEVYEIDGSEWWHRYVDYRAIANDLDCSGWYVADGEVFGL